MYSIFINPEQGEASNLAIEQIHPACNSQEYLVQLECERWICRADSPRAIITLKPNVLTFPLRSVANNVRRAKKHGIQLTHT